MFKAKKSLGQNFLKSELALRKIIEAGEIKRDDIVLEIGPGRGALTSKLLENADRVVAVEKDYELFEFLKIKFEKEIKLGSLVLIHDDILKFDSNKGVLDFFSGPRFPSHQARPDHSKKSKLLCYKIIANIPYNITGAILKKFLTEKHQPETMVLMIQHEVATRILARDGKESILSISVKAYGEPKMIMKVDKRYFSPAPKVNSAIIAIRNISRANFTSISENSPLPNPSPSSYDGEGRRGEGMSTINHQENNEEKFWQIVKAGFAHKRKKLSSNLKNLSKNEGFILTNDLGNKRAEDLTLSDWIVLARY